MLRVFHSSFNTFWDKFSREFGTDGGAKSLFR